MPRGSEGQRIPQPKPRPIVGNIPDVDADAPVQSFCKLAREYGPLYRLSFPAGALLLASSLEYADQLCDETRFEKYVPAALKHIRDFAGDGLFTAYGNEPNWGKAHRILMPAFGQAAMKRYFDDMLDIADQMFTRWERFGPTEVIDVSDNMTRLTLDTIALCGFNYRFNSFYQREMHPFVDAMVSALAEASSRARRVPLQTQLMLLTQRHYEANAALMHRLTGQLVAQRRQEIADDPSAADERDLLGLMLNARDPVSGERLDDQNIRYQLVTFLIAGHETTSGLLSFATHLLLENPDVMARARALVDEVLGDEQPRFEDLARLGYIDQILRETLRLYPTAPAFALRPKADGTPMGDLELNRRDIVLVLTPMLHRDPQVWERPDVFDPDRFAPGRREHIPAHAWLPFGNGERSCIGRAFALQEAALVLAMMLQRFDISRPGLYALRIKETLTLKPEGLTIRARQRRAVTRTLGGRPAAAMAGGAAQPPAAMASHGTPLLALYGSNSGASEAFARRIASDGEARGYAVRVAPMDEYAGRLPRGGAVVIVTASYNGQPPDNARAFMTWLAGMPQASLSGLRHAVFGCGNKDWFATYQEIPKRVAELLHAAGSGAFMERGEADGREDFFGDFERWYQPFWDRLGEALGVAAQTVGTEPLYRVEVLPPSAIRLIEQNQLEMATIVDNVELVDLGSPFGRSKRHIVLDLPPGTSYAAGDYLALLPQNHPEVVERAARRFAVRPDAAILLRSNRGAMAASLPTERPVSVRELLGGHVELSTPARQIDVASIASRLACPPHREALAAIAQDGQRYRAEILDKRVSVLDLLETYPDCDLSLAEFLEMLPAMRVRQYSISSSPRMGPTRCSLTVAVVSAPAWSGHGQYHGICSTWLARLKPGDSVPVAIRTPNAPFHPPASNATPIVMIAAGTGIAPFRGFIEERAARKAAGERTGPALLFFGCDHPDVDFLYHEELERWASEGVVEVLPAFYHQPDGEIRFVQHRLWRERERVKAAFLDGTVFFLCGDGKAMAPAVRRTLERIYQEVSGCGDEEAAVWLHEMEAQGRYVPDVFA